MHLDEQTTLIGALSSTKSSLGTVMYHAGYEKLGLNFLYIPFAVEDCRAAVLGLLALHFRGFTVSMPFKEEVMQYLDEIDTTAKTIGAVNTVLIEDKKMSGYNSDWIGAVEALKEVVPVLTGKRVALLGAGGAAKAIAFGLRKEQAIVTIFNRTENHARDVARTLHVQFGGNLETVQKQEYDILINATSVGFLDTTQSIIDERLILPGTVVMDVVFHQVETLFLKKAKMRGCTVIPGYRMLIHQALFQFQLFTGRDAPFSIMEKALLEHLS